MCPLCAWSEDVIFRWGWCLTQHSIRACVRAEATHRWHHYTFTDGEENGRMVDLGMGKTSHRALLCITLPIMTAIVSAVSSDVAPKCLAQFEWFLEICAFVKIAHILAQLYFRHTYIKIYRYLCTCVFIAIRVLFSEKNDEWYIMNHTGYISVIFVSGDEFERAR